MHRSSLVALLVLALGLASSCRGATAGEEAPQLGADEAEASQDAGYQVVTPSLEQLSAELPPWWDEPDPFPSGPLWRRPMYRLIGSNARNWALGSIALPVVFTSTLFWGATLNFDAIPSGLVLPFISLVGSFVASLSVWPSFGVSLAIVRESSSYREMALRFHRNARTAAICALIHVVLGGVTVIVGAATRIGGVASLGAITLLVVPVLAFPAGLYSYLGRKAEEFARLSSHDWLGEEEALGLRRRPPPRILAAGPSGFALAF